MKAAGLRLQASGLLLAAACAHTALPAAQPLGGPSREELAKVAVQKMNEAFPEPAKVSDLAHALVHTLATSPRLKEFLTPAK